MAEETQTNSREDAFVHFILERCVRDSGEAARLRRADNPATEYQAWETLAAFNIDIENSWERMPFAIIAAAIARSKQESNGKYGIGRALAACYEDKHNSDQAKSKLRRLLACDSVEEVCRIVRPLLSLIESRQSQDLDFARLLKQLLWFNKNPLRVKTHWAQDFYRNNSRETSS